MTYKAYICFGSTLLVRVPRGAVHEIRDWVPHDTDPDSSYPVTWCGLVIKNEDQKVWESRVDERNCQNCIRRDS